MPLAVEHDLTGAHALRRIVIFALVTHALGDCTAAAASDIDILQTGATITVMTGLSAPMPALEHLVTRLVAAGNGILTSFTLRVQNLSEPRLAARTVGDDIG